MTISIIGKTFKRIVTLIFITAALLSIFVFSDVSSNVSLDGQYSGTEEVAAVSDADFIADGEEAVPASKTDEPKINAGAAIVMDMGSGRVLYEKSAYTRRPMASTTKIMTGIVAIEYGNPDEMVTCSQRAAAIGGSTLGLQKGKQYRLGDLIIGLLMKSGNDAAIAIAEHIGGTVDGYLAMMNEKARQIGTRDTQFKTPHGLDAEGHYTTAYDLALITRYALQNETFSKIVSTHVCVINGRQYENTNEMLDSYAGADGVKTGYTGKAGRCLVTSATRGDLRLISVVLFCATKSQRAASSRKILDYAFANYSLKELVKGGTYIADLPVDKGRQKTVAVRIAESVKIPMSESEMACAEIKYNLAKDIPAPVYAGTDVGTAQIYAGDELLGEVTLKAWENVERKNFFDNLDDIFGKWFNLVRDGMF